MKGIPEGNWYCERCEELLSDKSKKCTDIKCFLCPDIDGAIKKVKRGDKESWGHVVCINWMPDIFFLDEEICQIGG